MTACLTHVLLGLIFSFVTSVWNKRLLKKKSIPENRQSGIKKRKPSEVSIAFARGPDGVLEVL
jgi:hypothetical protein